MYHLSVQAPSAVIQVSMSPPITQHLDHLVTPTQSTWRHLARCHFAFWSHLKSSKKIIKKNLKNQVTLLHHNPIKTIRVHPPGCLRKGGTWRNAIALLTAISIGIAFEIMDTGPRVHIMARIAVHRTDLNHIHTGWMNSENRRG